MVNAVLSAVLCEINMAPSSTTKLYPFEIIMGRQFPTTWVHDKGDLDVQEYTVFLIGMSNKHCTDVSPHLPLPLKAPTQMVGEAAYGPYTEVIAVTCTSVLTRAVP